MANEHESAPKKLKADFRDPEVRKSVAEMLLNGATQEEIAKHFGYAQQGSIGFFLHRAGGTDKVIQEALGEDAVKKYREWIAESRRVGKSHGGGVRYAEGGLDEDVRLDASQGLSPKRFAGLGEKDPSQSRPEMKSSGISTEGAVASGTEKRLIDEIDRAARIKKYEAEVRPLVGSVIDAISKHAHADQKIPATIMYADMSTATGGNIKDAIEKMEGENVVIRVRLPGFKATQPETRVARNKVATFIAQLRTTIDQSDKSDSELGQIIRAWRKQTRIELQIMWGGTPITLTSKTLE